MSFDTMRPILSGIAGAIIAGWLVTKWARWVPAKVGTKGRGRLLNEHRVTIRVANVLALTGILIGLVCYQCGWLARNDWRGLGLGGGLTAFLPICYIVVVRAADGAEAVRECLITYAISQKTPTLLFYGLLSLMFIAGAVSAVSFFT